MARKTEVRLIDDLDGGDAAESVKFGLDGTNYEIDLSAGNADRLRKAMAEFIVHARRLGRGGLTGRPRGGGPARTDREQNAAIREWAKREGIELADRGRIPGHIAQQYHERAGR
jgi:Lsr2